VVLSSRARLARNVEGFRFPGRADERDLKLVAQQVRRAALADVERLADLAAIAIDALTPHELGELEDARRVSPELAAGGPHRYALLDDDGALSVFVNEEDHVRLQSLAAGSGLHEALRDVEDADRRLSRRLRYAVHARWGHLTASLSNMGTGLRLSSLLHLPALGALGRVEGTLRAARHLGISIRGAHGEHSVAAGDLYQVSNAVTLGLSTGHIEGRVRPVVEYLVAAERAARRELAETAPVAARAASEAGEAWRYVEAVSRLSARDALEILSRLRLAAACGIALAGVPAPGDALFTALVIDLRTGAGLTDRSTDTGDSPASAVREAIQRPAKLRSALRTAPFGSAPTSDRPASA
jgi:protein arginine kinase